MNKLLLYSPREAAIQLVAKAFQIGGKSALQSIDTYAKIANETTTLGCLLKKSYEIMVKQHSYRWEFESEDARKVQDRKVIASLKRIAKYQEVKWGEKDRVISEMHFPKIKPSEEWLALAQTVVSQAEILCKVQA